MTIEIPRHRNLLSSIGLTEEQKSQRMSVIGGSDANTIMSGNDEWIMDLWRVKTGKAEPDDLSDNLPVAIGQYTEDLNAAWYEKVTGDLVDCRNERCLHGEISYMAANIDGKCLNGESVWEAKHVGQFSNFPDVLSRYMPQLHHNAYVIGAKKATISVFIGTFNYEFATIDLDEFYLEVLLSAESRFWKCVKEDIPPTDVKFEKVTIDFDDMIECDMTGNNEWASLADDFLQNKEQAKKFEAAKTSLKKMVKDNVRKAFGHGISISRAKNGNLTIR